MSNVVQRRQAQRQKFSSHLRPLVDSVGGPVSFVERTGRSQVTAWLSGECIPYVETIVEICELLGWDLPAMLAAAGKPPIESLREAAGTAFATTLPAQLQAYRDRLGGDSGVAAKAMGLDRFEYSRLATGSRVPATLQRCNRIARALGVSIVDVLDAATVGDGDPLRVELARKVSGQAGVVRDQLEGAGIDSWEDTGVRRAARIVSITQ